MPDLTTPNGCRWCGVAEREHLQRWTPAAKWHQWVEPTDAQRKERMLARRAAAMAETRMAVVDDRLMVEIAVSAGADYSEIAELLDRPDLELTSEA